MEGKYFLNMLVMSNNRVVNNMTDMIGADGTDVFEDTGHTWDTRDLAKQYLIGTIADQVS